MSIIHYHVHIRQIGNLGHQFVDGVPTPILTAAILRCLKCGDSQGLAGSLNTLELSWMTLLAMCFCWGPKIQAAISANRTMMRKRIKG